MGTEKFIIQFSPLRCFWDFFTVNIKQNDRDSLWLCAGWFDKDDSVAKGTDAPLSPQIEMLEGTNEGL